MKYDLTTDDGLRRAWRYICQSANVEDPQKDIVQKFDKVRRDDFLNEDYQRLLWEENEICSIRRPPRVKVDEIIQDNRLMTWFYKKYKDIKKKESSQRINDLCDFVEKLYTKLKPYTTKNERPVCRTYRTMAALFPDNFTRCASTTELKRLAKHMGFDENINNVSQHVKIHFKILDRLKKVLDKPKNLNEVIQRMIWSRDLPDATGGIHLPSLKTILPLVNRKGYFPDDLCLKLHLGLWADERRHFAVLTGLSGAGKTLLARAYAEAITEEDPTGENPKRSCIVAVQPGWTDPSYLLGYANPLRNDTFEKTPFLKLLHRATDEPHTPHVAILDEMNLSHPEQYMAPLLSAMETGGSIEIHGRGETFDGVRNHIPYPNNLVLIGTVNMDETTHGLVDKLLDRAFTLEFWKVDVDMWRGWEKNELPAKKKENIKEILNALMKALEPARLHFGYRVIEEIVAFLKHYLQDYPEWPLEDALDAVVYAKVLPKLRGDDSKRISDALKECKKVLVDEDKEEKRGFILSNSANKVEELIKDLEASGSARFWR
ncbi:MAG: hypothetical protein F4W91_04270 [Gemmatimonadetes bacterium]|nr:hypothetical protein [Gemmatimonadota bacterium]